MAFRNPCFHTIAQLLSPFARREDVVLPQRLEHRGADDQRVVAVQHQAKRESRQDHVLGPVHEEVECARIAEYAVVGALDATVG
jgi:hypothetical protein